MKEIKTNKRLQDSLMPNESVILVAPHSKIFRVPGFVMGAFGLLVMISAISASSFSEFLAAVLSVAMCTCACFLPALIFDATSVLAVTNKKIYGRKGIIRVRELESPLNKIENIKVKRSITGRILKYGAVCITTTTGIYEFNYIKNAEDFRKTVMAQIEATEYDKMDVHAEKIASAINRNK